MNGKLNKTYHWHVASQASFVMIGVTTGVMVVVVTVVVAHYAAQVQLHVEPLLLSMKAMGMVVAVP
jgi:hypothetical protein